jgi:hypothetical protein
MVSKLSPSTLGSSLCTSVKYGFIQDLHNLRSDQNIYLEFEGIPIYAREDTVGKWSDTTFEKRLSTK